MNNVENSQKFRKGDLELVMQVIMFEANALGGSNGSPLNKAMCE